MKATVSATNDKIEFVDLKAQYRSLAGEVDVAMAAAVAHTDFILGEDVRLFEEEFAAYCGASHCAGTVWGLEALPMALMACGIAHGIRIFRFVSFLDRRYLHGVVFDFMKKPRANPADCGLLASQPGVVRIPQIA